LARRIATPTRAGCGHRSSRLLKGQSWRRESKPPSAYVATYPHLHTAPQSSRTRRA
jgi:hypothetical protein